MPTLLLGRVLLHPGVAVDDAAIVVDGETVTWVGPRAALPDAFRGLPAVAAPLWTAGLVDAHTHAAWLGSRHAEYVMKLRGEGYEAIAARGGGILASMRAIEEDQTELADVLIQRLRRMRAMGVTTVEVKSGYGLEPHLERAQLEAIAVAARAEGVPRVVPTYLALHALPLRARKDAAARAAYVAGAIALTREVVREGFARFVDAYVDRNAFQVDEARGVAMAAKEAGAGVRLHVGQFADIGGAALAAEVGAASVDHMEHATLEGLDQLAKAGVRVGLLPVASFVLGQAPPEIAGMRRAGLRMFVASDANPGTAPTESLPLALAFAARSYGLTADEVLGGATVEAAASLDLPSVGRVAEGAAADLVGWELPHEDALLQPWGVRKAKHVFVRGVACRDARDPESPSGIAG